MDSICIGFTVSPCEQSTRGGGESLDVGWKRRLYRSPYETFGDCNVTMVRLILEDLDYDN